MAQDFERNIANNVGTSASTIFTADSDDAVVGINIANVTSSQIKVSVFITVSSVDYHLVKDAPVPAQSAIHNAEPKIMPTADNEDSSTNQYYIIKKHKKILSKPCTGDLTL